MLSKVNYKSMRLILCTLPKIVSVAALAFFSTSSISAARASSFFGLTPGAPESSLRSVLSGGSGFYQGIVDNTYINAIAIGGTIMTVQLCYLSNPQVGFFVPINLQRRVDLQSAIRFHSLNAAAQPSKLCYATALSGTLVDTNNDVVYLYAGALNPNSLVASVSYVKHDAPVIQRAAQLPLSDFDLQQLGIAPKQTDTTALNTGEQSEKTDREAEPKPKEQVWNMAPRVMPKTMEECLSIELVDKKLAKFGAANYIYMNFQIQNKTPKDIKGFKGAIFLEVS